MHSSSCRKNDDGWTLDQGLAAQYAAQAGLDPDLAADAGEAVWDVLKSLRDATSATDPQRQAKLVRRTKARLAKANLSRHDELVQHIEAKLLALQGRGGDTELAHLTPGEMIVPPQLQTAEVVRALQQAAHTAGIDMAQYTAGSQASRMNPETGLEEFSVECADEGGCRQEPGGYRGPNIFDYGGTTFVNVTDTSTSPTGRYDAYSAGNWAGGSSGTGPIGVQFADAGGGRDGSIFNEKGDIDVYETCSDAAAQAGICSKSSIPFLSTPTPEELSKLSNFELWSKLLTYKGGDWAADLIASPSDVPIGYWDVLDPFFQDLSQQLDPVIDAYQTELDRRSAR
ncbi:MAG: hypothetical protein RIB43_16720 [Rhodospirillaceae bacterium]